MATPTNLTPDEIKELVRVVQQQGEIAPLLRPDDGTLRMMTMMAEAVQFRRRATPPPQREARDNIVRQIQRFAREYFRSQSTTQPLQPLYRFTVRHCSTSGRAPNGSTSGRAPNAEFIFSANTRGGWCYSKILFLQDEAEIALCHDLCRATDPTLASGSDRYSLQEIHRFFAEVIETEGLEREARYLRQRRVDDQNACTNPAQSAEIERSYQAALERLSDHALHQRIHMWPQYHGEQYAYRPDFADQPRRNVGGQFADYTIERTGYSKRTKEAKEAEARGLALLRENLSSSQLEEYNTKQYFHVIGNKTKTRYRILYGRQVNIRELDGRGEIIAKLCFLPAGYLVAGDIMLAQKLALELQEEAVLRVVNRTPYTDAPVNPALYGRMDWDV